MTVLLLALELVVAIVALLCIRPLRWLYAEWPLRKITHRRRPDYGRIAEMEREIWPQPVPGQRGTTIGKLHSGLAEAARMWQPRTGGGTWDGGSGRTCPPARYEAESRRREALHSIP